MALLQLLVAHGPVQPANLLLLLRATHVAGRRRGRAQQRARPQHTAGLWRRRRRALRLRANRRCSQPLLQPEACRAQPLLLLLRRRPQLPRHQQTQLPRLLRGRRRKLGRVAGARRAQQRPQVRRAAARREVCWGEAGGRRRRVGRRRRMGRQRLVRRLPALQAV